MVLIAAETLTLGEFLAQSETRPPREYLQGRIQTKPMPQGQHSRLQQKLIPAINHVAEAQEMAIALPELRCTFGGESIIPDLAIFRWERLPVNPDGTLANFFPIPPDWMIEILSPQQPATRVTGKILEALRHGTDLGWLIDPAEQLVLTYPANSTPTLFPGHSSQPLPVPPWLPGLELTPIQIFSWLQIQRPSPN